MMNPVQIVVDGPAGSPQVKAAVQTLQTKLATDEAFGPTRIETDPAGELTLVQTPVAGTSSGDLALAKVRQLRSDYIPVAFEGAGADVYVTGASATNVDEMDVVNGRTPWVIGLVLALSFALLLLAFRSVVVSATAIVMNLLSVGAAFGLVTLVFEKGIGLSVLGFQRAEAIDQWVPLFMFSILFGLSMDYQVFLISRIREHFERTGDNDAAVVHGVSSTAGIITGAALIMVAVFTGFASGQLVMLQELGFGLGVAVLLDATVVRVLLVPATMTVLGHANWYLPAWLQWLPQWNVEGAHEQPGGRLPDVEQPSPAREPVAVPQPAVEHVHAGAHPVPVPTGHLLGAHRREADDSRRRPEF
jgi:RND superfamily putative drug exporter